MGLLNSFDPLETDKLFGYAKNFDFLKNLISRERFPSVLMLTGNKGIGKCTLAYFLHYYYDKIHYNYAEKSFLSKSTFHRQLKENVFPNVFYISSSNQKITIDEIRNLKVKLSKTSINNLKRFIIIDEIESLNLNCLNGLLKIIEEPNNKDHFILINNKKQLSHVL